ncbi:MAG: Maf family protein [Spirochaetaceae bacterium]|jgi:septum formation protein|nr:Maf family protein [Spirochaetaceae bacterium]
MEKLILASSSPQRREILIKLDIPFEVIPPEIDEITPKNLPPDAWPEHLAVQKARAVAARLSASQPGDPLFGCGVRIILAADTLIVFRGAPYGKPGGAAQAARFLADFSGDTHTVLTAIALLDRRSGEMRTKTCRAAVTFAPLSAGRIAQYLATGEWRGAAGGYRIQGAGRQLITRVEGLESVVVGLPEEELVQILAPGIPCLL